MEDDFVTGEPAATSETSDYAAAMAHVEAGRGGAEVEEVVSEPPAEDGEPGEDGDHGMVVEIEGAASEDTPKAEQGGGKDPEAEQRPNGRNQRRKQQIQRFRQEISELKDRDSQWSAATNIYRNKADYWEKRAAEAEARLESEGLGGTDADRRLRDLELKMQLGDQSTKIQQEAAARREQERREEANRFAMLEEQEKFADEVDAVAEAHGVDSLYILSKIANGDPRKPEEIASEISTRGRTERAQKQKTVNKQAPKTRTGRGSGAGRVLRQGKLSDVDFGTQIILNRRGLS